MSAEIKETVKARYAAAAKQVLNAQAGSCCGPASKSAKTSTSTKASCCSGEAVDPITVDLYSAGETASIPESAVLASLGCGNPTALAELRPGEVVLDLGSGGGIDVLLSARRVGPSGKAYGLDMTDEMLELARQNQRKAGVTNVEFLKGEIEDIPLPDNSVDVIISNCVINLSADKGQVLKEAFRVLKPGGRFAVSDIVRRGALAPEIARSMELWAGCVAGALEENEYRKLLLAAGFSKVSIEPTRIYGAADARAFLESIDAADVEKLVAEADGAFMSAFVRATK